MAKGYSIPRAFVRAPAAVLPLLAGAVPPGAAADAQRGAWRRVPPVLDQDQGGAVRRVRVGETIEIQLARYGGTGASWVAIEGEGEISSGGVLRTGGRMYGSPEVDLFRFCARYPGTYLVGFSLQRPWEEDQSDAQTVYFTIVVR